MRRAALIELLTFLKRSGYRHTAVTPSTHATVLARPFERQPSLSDILGWNRPFERDDVESELLSILEEVQAVRTEEDGLLRSTVRVASLNGDLFVHSGFPTNYVDAVFFGPDTYRFVQFIARHVDKFEGANAIADMGAGSGAGAIATARALGNPRIVLVDVNPTALFFAACNAAAAGIEVDCIRSDRVPSACDLLMGNAPYLMDTMGRSYRDGGDLFGGAVSLDWVRQALATLGASQTILLYTGAAYVSGESPLLREIEQACLSADALLIVEEIDPDVFGEQLLEPGYESVERIAATGLVIRRI